MNGLRSIRTALENIADDLEAFPTDEGLSYLNARRLRNINKALASLHARDLLSYTETKP